MRPTEIKTIPHNFQLYPTVGNYIDYDDGSQRIFVSEVGNEDYEFCIAIHELIESHICRKRGIKNQDITNFDCKFESERKPGDETEAGDDKNAPYKREHFFATSIERLVAAELGIDWEIYEKTLDDLYLPKSSPSPLAPHIV